MYKLMLSLIMMLLLIVLMLTVSLLTILLWSAVILLKPMIKRELKKKEITARNNNQTVRNSTSRAEVNSKAQGTKGQERSTSQHKKIEGESWESALPDSSSYDTDASDGYCDVREPEKQNGQSLNTKKNMPVQISSFPNIDPMEIVRGHAGEKNIKLKSGNYTGKQQVGVKIWFTEARNGKIAVYATKKNEIYVVPVKEIISEKECNVGDIGACFSVHPQLSDGQNYRIIAVNRPCIMERTEEGYYTIVEKGDLVLEEVR